MSVMISNHTVSNGKLTGSNGKLTVVSQGFPSPKTESVLDTSMSKGILC